MFNFLKEKPHANPDAKLKLIKTKCPANHLCPSVRVCPVGALSQNGYAAPIIDYKKCTSCGKCARYCPRRALVME